MSPFQHSIKGLRSRTMNNFAAIKTMYANTHILNQTPFVGFQDNVVSPQECEYLMALAAGKTQRAKVSLDKDSDIVDGRSGSNCWLRYSEDEVVNTVGQRIAEIVGIPLAHAESMQVIHYGPEQEYRGHYDAYDLTTERGQRCCRYGGQRLVTALVYLNDVELGGGTSFARLKTEVQAKQGRMALFHNVGDDYNAPHPDSLHAGEPVQAGEKWAFNIWFHARPMQEVQDFQTYSDLQTTPPTSPKKSTAASTQTRSTLPYQVNRASQVFQQAISQLDPVLVRRAQPVYFTYWDTYGNSYPDLSGLSAATSVFKLVDRRIANTLSNKASLARSLSEHQLASLAPQTCFSIAEAMRCQTPPNIWFIKNIYGSGGKNMACVTHEQLANVELSADQIVQAGVTELALYDGKKFTVRLYCLIWEQKIYLYQNGFLVVHGRAYDPNSTDYAVQIDHTGYEKQDSPVALVPLIEYEGYHLAYPKIKHLIQSLSPVLESTRQASSSTDYLILGVDVLLQEDGSASLLEINTIPNFIHSPDIIKGVNIPFFKATLSTMLGDQSVVLEQIKPL